MGWTFLLLLDFQVQGIRVPSQGAIVVHDNCLGTRQALLGMNVISDFWEQLFQQKSSPLAMIEATYAKDWKQVFTDCHRIRTTTNQQDTIDTAWVSCRYALTIPTNGEALVFARLAAETPV